MKRQSGSGLLGSPRELLVIAALLAAVLMSEVAFRWMPEPRIAIRVFCGAAFLVAGITYAVAIVRLKASPDIEDFGGPALIDDIGQDEIDQLIDGSGAHRVGYAQARFFLRSLRSPRSVFERISEDVHPLHRSTLIRTSFTVSFARVHGHFAKSTRPNESGFSGVQAKGDFVVPLHVPRRGEMIDGLRVYEAGDGRVSTLTSPRQLAFQLAVVRVYAKLASPSTFLAYRRDVEPSVIRLFRRVAPASPDQINRVVRRVRRLPVAANSTARIEDMIYLVRTLSRWNPVCAIIPGKSVGELRWPYTTRLRLERRTVGRYDRAPGASRRALRALINTLELAFAVRPNVFFVSLLNATRSSSYHLQVAGPEGTFLGRQEILGRQNLTSPVVLQARRGQRRAHLHARGFRRGDGTHLAVAYYERAPGSFATATLSAVSAAAVVGVLAIREAVTSGAADTNVPLVSALLAIPIGVAALAGIDPNKELRHPSLLSRLITFATILLSILAFAVTVLSPALSWRHDLSVRLWALLAFGGLGVAVVSGLTWLMRLRVEGLLNTSGDENDQVEGRADPTRSEV